MKFGGCDEAKLLFIKQIQSRKNTLFCVVIFPNLVMLYTKCTGSQLPFSLSTIVVSTVTLCVYSFIS